MDIQTFHSRIHLERLMPNICPQKSTSFVSLPFFFGPNRISYTSHKQNRVLSIRSSISILIHVFKERVYFSLCISLLTLEIYFDLSCVLHTRLLLLFILFSCLFSTVDTILKDFCLVQSLKIAI